MRRIVVSLTTLILLAAAGAAAASLPATPGVAFVDEGYTYTVGGYATYSGGPLTQNHIVAEVSANAGTTTFDAPNTVMVPDPVEAALAAYNTSFLAGSTGEPPKGGPEEDCTYPGVGHISCDTHDACFVTVSGNIGYDTITVRYLAPARTVFTGPIPFSYKPCGFIVNGDRGNDTIDTFDGRWSHVSCGGARDHVRADPDDVVDGDCEVVTRS
jgi:hypothetical protein